MSLPIKQIIDRNPRCMMQVLLGAGALIANLAPDNSMFFGSFTGWLVASAIPSGGLFGDVFGKRAMPHDAGTRSRRPTQWWQWCGGSRSFFHGWKRSTRRFVSRTP
jgi:hypothetical protein